MIDEEFKKEPDGKSYLYLRKTKETYEETMIQKARPIGILPMVRSERSDAYKYEITGKKSLAMTFERVPMNAEQIEGVLQGILDVVERGREYLLSEENFILCPEHIFLRIPEYEVTLCYYPEYGVPLDEQLGKLFELLLNRVDYREEKAIAMVYALYMQLQEPDMTPERIREKLHELVEVKGQTETTEQRMVRSKEKQDNKTDETRVVTEPAETFRQKTESAAVARQKNTQRKTGLWEKFRKEVTGRKLNHAEKREVITSPSLMPCVRETAPEWGTQYTKVLSVKRTESGPALISQRNGETIFLTKFPFYIGSHPGYMDYVIRQDTVSRFHAKLVRQGDSVALVDLNSTNGTKLNGRLLNVQEQIQLADGDRILFAEEEFRYYENKERVSYIASDS